MSAELQLEKSDWNPATFGDVAKEVRQSTKDPVADGIERVVGLEHIEPESIHLRNWASIDEGTTFTKTFRKGHVLFGRRRAYLKKAAQAKFNGICSGDITVMEAKEELLPELLPFLVNNDKFFDYAVQHSAGGLSPRTKFKDLSNYEFLLPPKDQQTKLAGLLWSTDEAIQKATLLSASHLAARSALLKEVFSRSKDTVPIGEVVKLSSGKSRPKDLADEPLNEHVHPVYGGNGIIGYATEPNVSEATIVLGRVGEYCGVVHDTRGPSWISDNALYVKEWKLPINRIYVSRFFEFLDLNKQQTGGGQPLITQSLVCRNNIPIPSPDRIAEAVKRIDQLESNQLRIKDQISHSKHLLKSLINQIF